MLHDQLRRYLEEFQSTIGALENAYVERYQEEILTPCRVNLRIRIRFSEGSLLELTEAVVVETELLRHLGYRYHFQNKENRLLFRYYNTPHFPELDGFPHHKHLENDVKSCEKPSIEKIVEEARAHSRK
jgi:hypothetical protein